MCGVGIRLEQQHVRYKRWYEAHKIEDNALRREQYKIDPFRHRTAVARWVERNPEEARHIKQRWKQENPAKYANENRRRKAKRRVLGFHPLNSPFPGCEGHHINPQDVIYIPKKLHLSVRHNIWTGKNMDTMNALAGQYMTEGWT